MSPLPPPGCYSTGAPTNSKARNRSSARSRQWKTAIWLAEVARSSPRYAHIRAHIREANKQANPGLSRVALKMATGSGKTTVMAMMIAWQAVNAVRAPAQAGCSAAAS